MDIIEVMARAANDGTEPLELTRRDIIDALRAAESAGWRLVPVEATEDMIDAIYDHVIDFDAGIAWRQASGAAPRPWEEA